MDLVPYLGGKAEDSPVLVILRTENGILDVVFQYILPFPKTISQ